MSMWLDIARVSAEAFAKIEKNPKLLDAIFFEEDEAVLAELGLGEDHICGVDYLSLNAAYEAMAEATGEEIDEDILKEDLGPTEELDYDVGYGPAFYIEPARVKSATEGSMIPEMDDEAQEVFAQAAKQGEYLIGVIS